MSSSSGSFFSAIDRISSKVKGVIGGANSGTDQIIKNAFLRKTGNEPKRGMELVLPDGQVLTVVDDEVGGAVERIHMFLVRRALRVTGVVDNDSKTIRVKKVETSAHLDGAAGQNPEA